MCIMSMNDIVESKHSCHHVKVVMLFYSWLWGFTFLLHVYPTPYHDRISKSIQPWWPLDLIECSPLESHFKSLPNDHIW